MKVNGVSPYTTSTLFILITSHYKKTELILELLNIFLSYFLLKLCLITCETLPVPVKTKVKGPMDFGIRPSAISYPASRIAA